MPALTLTRFFNPSKYRREQPKARVAVLRQRDGECCRRCRRPIRFDLPVGHDLGALIDAVVTGANAENIANLCLTHGRCNVSGQDRSAEVLERLRPQREAELFVKAREKRAA